MATALRDDEVRIPPLTIGRRMAIARQEAGLNAQDMAELLGKSSGTISNWESGASQPRNLIATMTRWAEITRVPLTWLLTGEGTIVSCFGRPHLRLVPLPDGQMELF